MLTSNKFSTKEYTAAVPKTQGHSSDTQVVRWSCVPVAELRSSALVPGSRLQPLWLLSLHKLIVELHRNARLHEQKLSAMSFMLNDTPLH